CLILTRKALSPLHLPPKNTLCGQNPHSVRIYYLKINVEAKKAQPNLRFSSPNKMLLPTTRSLLAMEANPVIRHGVTSALSGFIPSLRFTPKKHRKRPESSQC
ncbi:MAG: hypothetical protein NWR72_20315, partial [Bacteroidia bacterium]|nr:hypothetical protein [Bacteroidia bacterium]